MTNAGRELTLGELRLALRNPGSRKTPGYELVTVEVKGAEKLRGFVRGRTNFDIQVQLLDGTFRSVQASQIAAVKDEPGLMKPVEATAAEFRDLVAYLASVEKAGAPAATARTNRSVDGHSTSVVRRWTRTSRKPASWINL